ncbi:MAG: hypothetical protein JXA89_18045 [Anaerolineae bacterium]|nr:hypothetical protein [Anaerolineae bacterium]
MKRPVEAHQVCRYCAGELQRINQRQPWSVALALLSHIAYLLDEDDQAKTHLLDAMQMALDCNTFFAQLLILATMARRLADRGQLEQAVELYALASRHPVVANSRWYAGVFELHIAAAAAILSPDIVAAAQERGRARNLRTTVIEWLADMKAFDNE